MRPRLYALFVPALSPVAAGGCHGAATNEHWWEEGYPFAAGAAGPAAPAAAEHSPAFPGPEPAQREGAGASAVARMLERTRVPALSVRREESLRGAVEAVRVVTGLPLVVDPAAEAAALDAGAVFDLELTNPLAARHVGGRGARSRRRTACSSSCKRPTCSEPWRSS